MTELADLHRTLDELKRRVSELENEQDTQVFGRRQLLRRLGTVGAGAVALSAVGAHSASAADGNTMTIGMNNMSGNTVATRLGYSSMATGSKAGFIVQDSTASLPAFTSVPAILGYADGTTFSAGVAGYGTEAGVVAQSTKYGLKITSSQTHIKMTNDGTINAPTSRIGGYAGEIVKDSNEALWYAIADSSNQNSAPATWRKLSGPGTAGSLHLLAAPYRLYDSRPGFSPATGPKTQMTAGITRVLAGAPAGLPTNATAVVCNVTAVSASGPGWFGVWASGAYPGNANVNWSSGGAVVNGLVISATNGQSFSVYCGNATADIIVDVVGYYA